MLDAATRHRMILERLHPRVVGAPGGPGLERDLTRLAGSAVSPGPIWIHLDRLAPEEADGLVALFGQASVHPSVDRATGERRALVGLSEPDLRARLPLLAVRAGCQEVAVAIGTVLDLQAARPESLALPGGRRLDLTVPVVMGVLNLTPDSFSDGGRFAAPEAARRHARAMAAAGAAIIDVGGQSTRPGSLPVEDDVEIDRVVGLVEWIATELPEVVVSIDTDKAAVARAALAVGASIVNDVTGLLGDPEMASVAAAVGAAVVVMHMRGTPRTMQVDPVYDDLLGEILSILREGVHLAEAAGVDPAAIAVDPGIGFGKTVDHNLEILRRLPELRSLGKPILVGTSRKSFIGHLTGRPVDERLAGTASTVALATAGGARLLRVHDVAEMVDVVRIAHGIAVGGLVGEGGR